jgi:hypothetical protein
MFSSHRNRLRAELMVIVSWISAIVFMVFEHELLNDLSNPLRLFFISIWLIMLNDMVGIALLPAVNLCY